jgi:hypothetical protein
MFYGYQIIVQELLKQRWVPQIQKPGAAVGSPLDTETSKPNTTNIVSLP